MLKNSLICSFQDDKEFVKVKDELLNSVMNKLKKIHGDVGKPGKSVMKEMILQLSYAYPSMFRESEEGIDHFFNQIYSISVSPVDKRQIPGIDRQAALLCDRVIQNIYS